VTDPQPYLLHSVFVGAVIQPQNNTCHSLFYFDFFFLDISKIFCTFAPDFGNVTENVTDFVTDSVPKRGENVPLFIAFDLLKVPYIRKKEHVRINLTYSFSQFYGLSVLFEPLPGLEPGTYALRRKVTY
jgi:hypothetical protein